MERKLIEAVLLKIATDPALRAKAAELGALLFADTIAAAKRAGSEAAAKVETIEDAARVFAEGERK